jgi:hypothetical protein
MLHQTVTSLASSLLVARFCSITGMTHICMPLFFTMQLLGDDKYTSSNYFILSTHSTRFKKIVPLQITVSESVTDIHSAQLQSCRYATLNKITELFLHATVYTTLCTSTP